MDKVELQRAKADVIAGFAGGPAMMIDNEDERDKRIASLLVLVELECSDTHDADVIHIHPTEIHGSNARIKWAPLIEDLRSNHGKVVTITYDKMHTATVTAAGVRQKYPDIDVMTERKGLTGIVTLTTR